MRCSHILHRVDDMYAAVRAFQQVGFTVAYGRRPGRTSNALIWFEAGPFIELARVPRLSPPVRWAAQLYGGRGVRHRVERWAERDRSWIDLAVETDDESIGLEDGDGVRLVELSGLTTLLDLETIGGLPLRSVSTP